MAEPLVNIGDVKSSLITFSPATTPSRKIRCSLASSYGTRTLLSASVASDADRPLILTLEMVESASCPAIFRQSRMIGGISPLCGDADKSVRVPSADEGA